MLGRSYWLIKGRINPHIVPHKEFDDVGSSLFPLVFPQAFDVAVKVIWPEGVHGLDSGGVVFAHHGLFWFKVL
jgi:hypothetical protein